MNSTSDMVSRLGSQVALVGGRVATMPDVSAVREYFAKLALDSDAKQMVVSEAAVSELVLGGSKAGPFKVVSRDTVSREEFYKALETADIGVTRVELAIAETGTLVIATSDEADRLVSALPRIHVALLETSQIVSSLEEAVPRISQILAQSHDGVSISLISASSRTTDVGGVLILGVHGPKELHILLIDEQLRRV
jgi:L-lactate dehydrogenase complex protein LldG